MTVAARRSPRADRSPDSKRSRTAGSTALPNAVRMRSRSRRPPTMSLTPFSSRPSSSPESTGTPALKSPVFNEPDPYFGGARPFEVISDRSIPNFYFYDWQRTEKIIGDEIDTMLKARKTPEKAWEDAEARLVADLGR